MKINMMTFHVFNMDKLLATMLVLVMSILLISCAGGPAPKEGKAPAVQVTAADIDSDVLEEFNQAVGLLKEQQYDKAIEILTAVVAKEQRFPAPYVNLGMAYVKKGDNKLAEENLRKALDIDLGHPIANNELGLIYRKSGRFEDARKAYENALVVHPEYLPARKNLGILCEIYLRDLKCALDQYEQYQGYVPDDKTVNIWIADLKRRMGN